MLDKSETTLLPHKTGGEKRGRNFLCWRLVFLVLSSAGGGGGYRTLHAELVSKKALKKNKAKQKKKKNPVDIDLPFFTLFTAKMMVITGTITVKSEPAPVCLPPNYCLLNSQQNQSQPLTCSSQPFWVTFTNELEDTW